MDINSLTPAEESLMEVLWQLEPSYMRDIMDAYPEPKPHQNTVSTYLRILVDKEFLTTEKEGRIFKYHVAVPYETYRRYKTKNLIDQFFNKDPKEFIKVLIESAFITLGEINSIFGHSENDHKNMRNRDHEKEAIQAYIHELISPPKDKDKKRKKKKKKRKKKLN